MTVTPLSFDADQIMEKIAEMKGRAAKAETATDVANVGTEAIELASEIIEALLDRGKQLEQDNTRLRAIAPERPKMVASTEMEIRAVRVMDWLAGQSSDVALSPQIFDDIKTVLLPVAAGTHGLFPFD